MDIKTQCARAIEEPTPVGRPLVPPIVASSTFEFPDQAAVDRYYTSGDGYVYSRYGNPTVAAVEGLLARLEGAERAARSSSYEDEEWYEAQPAEGGTGRYRTTNPRASGAGWPAR